jgi:hypothetical protein
MAYFSLSLISATEGFISCIKGVRPSNELTLILSPDEKKKISKGKYILILDTIWNHASTLKPEYKSIALTVNSPSKFSVDAKVGFSYGISCLSKAITVDM